MDSINISKLQFAWDSLTEHQQYRINMRYELKVMLYELPKDKTKRSCYAIIAERFPGYSIERIEYISSHESNNK